MVTSCTTTARSLQPASVGLRVGGAGVADGVTGVGKGVLVTGRVEVRKADSGVGSLDEIDTVQAVNARSKSEEIKTLACILLLYRVLRKYPDPSFHGSPVKTYPAN